MRKYNISLTATSVLFVLFALLAVIVGYFLSFNLSKKYLFTHELQYLRAVTDARGSELLFFLDAKSQRIQDLTSDRFIIDETRKTVRGAKDSSALRQYLVNQKMPTFKYIDKLLVLSLDGRVIASTDPSLLGKNESREEYFTNIQKKYTDNGKGHQRPGTRIYACDIRLYFVKAHRGRRRVFTCSRSGAGP